MKLQSHDDERIQSLDEAEYINEHANEVFFISTAQCKE